MRIGPDNPFKRITFCLAASVVLFSFQFCKSDRPSTDQSISPGISAYDRFPSWSPDGKKIAFVSDREGNHEIYTMNADSSDPVRLTDNPAFDWSPLWSPDSTKIAFVSNRDGNLEIYIMDTDGSNLTRLTDNPASDSKFSWSPDGEKILFAADRDGKWELYTMNSDGTDQTRLTNNSFEEAAPSWSPDGTKIAFHSRIDGNYDVYTLNSDGSNLTRLTEYPRGDGCPVWSPDGTQIVFHTNRDGNYEIYTMNADGSDKIRLTNEPSQDHWPNLSPDGKKIAFVSNRDFDQEVYVMDIDGSNPVNLTRNAPINETSGLTPLPQTELNLDEIPYKIVFQTYRETKGKENWEICLIDADGSDFVNLTNTPEIDELYPHASPDGRLVCFATDEGEELESKRRDVHYMNIDGTDRVKIAENAYQPCWSPDGKHIAYLLGEYQRHDPSVQATKGLEMYNLETGEKKQHPNSEIIHVNQLCWSPDGNWFIAASRGPIRAYKVDDKTVKILTVPGCTPDISPDGKLLEWNGTDWSLNTGALDFDSPLKTVTKHRIVVACDREHWVYFGDWTPDGNYLTFSYGPMDGRTAPGRRRPEGDVCICDLRTGKWTRITNDGKHNREPDWVPLQVR